MQLNSIVKAIKERTSYFDGRVAASATVDDIERLVALGLPCAVVVPLDDIAADLLSDSGYRQVITDQFSVNIILSNNTDERGEIAFSQLEEIKKQLFKALLGWQITPNHDIIIYAGGQLSTLDRSLLIYSLNFSYDYELGTTDSYLGNLDRLDDLLSIQIDAKPSRQGAGATITFINQNAKN